MKHSIKVSLQPSKSNDKPIRLRVSFCSLRVDLSVGVSYPAQYWKNDRPKNNTRNSNNQSAAEINILINKQIEFVENYFARCDIEHRNPTTGDLRLKFLAFVSRRSDLLQTDYKLSNFYDEFVQSRINQLEISDRTQLLWRCRLEKLDEFNEDITINTLSENILNDLKLFMQLQGMKNSSITTYVGGLQTFFNWLKTEKKFDINIKPVERIKIIHDDAKSYLTHEELKKLYEFNTDIYRQQLARDLFIFCAFTGLRFSDATKLKKIEISENKIQTTIKKTSKKIFIDLNKYALEVVHKYMDSPTETLFPSINISTYNVKLHEIFKRLNFNELVLIEYYQGERIVKHEVPKYEILSSHSARRTFVVECLQKGIPPVVIIRWTGHKDLKTLSPYIAIVDQQKKAEMDKFNEDL